MSLEHYFSLIQGHSVLNVGARGSELAELFQGKDYKTLDINPLAKPDIVGSAYEIPLPDSSIDAVIAISLIEHLAEPHRFVEEIKRILRPGGQILIEAPFLHPFHGGMNAGTYCADYYRFTHEGLLWLFRDFDVQIDSDGGFIYAMGSFFPRFGKIFRVFDFLYPAGKSKHAFIAFGSKK